MSSKRILIVEDDKNIVKMLEYNLEKEGYEVIKAFDGDSAIKIALKEVPDLIILDLMLPKIDGLEVCKYLKNQSSLSKSPIIILTAKSEESDKIIGLELGADDYVTKPFSPKELMARVKAILRRFEDKKTHNGLVKRGDLFIDFSKYIVKIKDKNVILTSKEFELLKVLIDSKGRALSSDFLLNAVWGLDKSIELETRTVDVHVASLRKKLKDVGKKIITIKNVGYRFEME